MSQVEIRPVTDKKSFKAFIDFYYDHYKGNKFNAPNLYSDEKNTLNSRKNAAFDFCEAQYFLAYRDGKIAGRVAAIINRRANEKWNRKCVRFGWIEYIDDIEVSKALLQSVADWGKEHGMEYVQGPLGFTDMDPEGMLTEGFDQLGTMETIYNYEYYPRHMEQLGMEKDNDYVEYKIPVPEKLPDRYIHLSEMIMKRYNLRIKKLSRGDVLKKGYGRKIFDVINATFSDLYGYSKMTERQIDQYVKMYFPMADLNLITVIEDCNADNKVVAVGITLPSLARALQQCNGHFFPFGWFYILRALKFHKTKIVDLLLIGVLPEYRNKGVNSLLFYDLLPHFRKYGFEWAETNVEMETNESVKNQWLAFEHELHKRRRCYIKKIK